MKIKINYEFIIRFIKSLIETILNLTTIQIYLILVEYAFTKMSFWQGVISIFAPIFPLIDIYIKYIKPVIF